MQKQPLILLVINMQVRFYVSRTSPQNNSELITNVEGRDISRTKTENYWWYEINGTAMEIIMQYQKYNRLVRKYAKLTI